MSLRQFIANLCCGKKEIVVYISAERAERDLINHARSQIECARATISVYESFERFLVEPLSLSPNELKSIVFRGVLNRAIAEGSTTITISRTEWPWVDSWLVIQHFEEHLRVAGFYAKAYPVYRSIHDSFETTGNFTITIRPTHAK